jgi:hypothetical protein
MFQIEAIKSSLAMHEMSPLEAMALVVYIHWCYKSPKKARRGISTKLTIRGFSTVEITSYHGNILTNRRMFFN